MNDSTISAGWDGIILGLSLASIIKTLAGFADDLLCCAIRL